jgi:putative addiction module killer protein
MLVVLSVLDDNIGMESQERKVEVYETDDGKAPYEDWLDSLRDRKAVGMIEKRIAKLRLGLFGDSKSVGEGVIELREHYGPGYRVYFALYGLTVVVLLCGGDKSNQSNDIATAKIYWKHYRSKNDG